MEEDDLEHKGGRGGGGRRIADEDGITSSHAQVSLVPRGGAPGDKAIGSNIKR